jgi:CheY-like chemotaxis protein
VTERGQTLREHAEVPRQRRVLVVEDNEVNYELASALLEFMGHDVSWARDGVSGLDAALSGAFDLVLLDLHIPKKSGREVLRALRDDARASGLPVLVLTAEAMLGTGEAILDGGASAYLSKPFDLDEFRSTVTALMP